MYSRVAIRVDPSAPWQWKSTALSSLSTLLQFLRLYWALPPDRLRVCSCSSREELNEQLVRENQGLASPSVTAAQFLQESRLCSGGAAQGTSAPGSLVHQEGSSLAVSSMGAALGLPCKRTTLDEGSMSRLSRRRLELGPGGDHDVAYSFALPASMPQVLWICLLARVHRGERQP